MKARVLLPIALVLATSIATTASTIPAATTTVPSGPTVVDHMMTLDPRIHSRCETPEPTSAFLSTDEIAWNWVFVRNARGGDEARWEFYRPDGTMDATLGGEFEGDGDFCWWKGLIVKGHGANYLGTWTVDFYYDEVYKYTDSFTITADLTATTTSTSSSTTTSTSSTATTSTSSPTTSSSTTTTIPSRRCAVSALYGEGSEEVEVLRNYRDKVLAKTPKGRKLIKLFYQFSPMIVQRMEEDPEFRETLKRFCDLAVKTIDASEE